MPTDSTTLIVFGVGAAILIWLVLSVMKKLFGLALLAGLVFGAYMLWTNPTLLRRAMELAGLA